MTRLRSSFRRRRSGHQHHRDGRRGRHGPGEAGHLCEDGHRRRSSAARRQVGEHQQKEPAAETSRGEPRGEPVLRESLPDFRAAVVGLFPVADAYFCFSVCVSTVRVAAQMKDRCGFESTDEGGG